jgi:hypothetical protein
LAFAVLTLAAAFFVFLAAGFVAAVDFGLGFLGPAVVLVEVSLGNEGAFVNRLKRGFRIRLWGGRGLDNTPPSGNVLPALAQILLLGRRPSPLSFRSSGVDRGGANSDNFRRSLCKDRIRIFPLYIAPVTRCVVSPAAAALRLLPRGRAPTGEVGVTTHDVPGRESEVTLRVTEALAAVALQRAVRSHVGLHRHL